MIDSRSIRLGKVPAGLLGFAAVVDGAMTVIYLSGRMFQLGHAPNWGTIVAGLVMAGLIFAMASKFQQPTAQHIVKYVSLLTLVETVGAAASYLATPVPFIIIGCLSVANCALIVLSCVVHVRTSATLSSS